MELKSNMRALQYAKKLLLGNTKNILPFPVCVQKPVPQQNPCVPLPRCTPAQAGVPALALDEFLRALSANPHVGTHHVYVLRHGKIVCDAHFAPYAPQYWHVSHSLCKTFTGTAIGMLVDDGLLSLDELICDIFPEYCSMLTRFPGNRMRSVTVKHLVTMRSGVNFREAGSVLEKNWVAAFLSSDVVFEPGSQFNYNSMNSYMLSAIVTNKTGMTLMDFLTRRLFQPLGFGSVAWETCPLGINKGGWGLYVLPEDLAKLALLYLQHGVWEGHTLLSAAWIDAATTPDSIHDNGEEYGYQLWTHSEDGSFLFNGMFGQYAFVIPSLDMVVAMNAGSGNLFTHGPAYTATMQLLQRVRDADDAEPLSASQNAAAMQALQFTLGHLRWQAPVPAPPSTVPTHKWFHALLQAFTTPAKPPAQSPLPAACHDVSGKSFLFPQKNKLGLLPIVTSIMCDYYTPGLSHIGFSCTHDTFLLQWTEGDVTQLLPIGFTQAAICHLNMGGNIFVCAVTGRFVTDEDDHLVLKLTLNLLETTSTQTIKLFFMPDGLRVHLSEVPSLPYVMELLQSTNPDFLKLNTGFMKDIDYLEFLYHRFCMPCLTGKPETPADINLVEQAADQ